MDRNSNIERNAVPDSTRHCPKCEAALKLARVAPSPSPLYQAHTFVCPGCDYSFTARVDL